MPRKSAKQAQLEAENAALRARLDRIEADHGPAEASPEIGAPLIRGAEKAKKSGTVTVACKIPQGLRLQLQHPMNRIVPTGRGSTDDYEKVTFNVFGGPVYHVFGPSMPAMGGVPDGYILPKNVEGGYALTPGIPADFWAQWLEQNKMADYVTSQMIFAHDDASSKDKAQDLEELKSGLEPLSREIDKAGRLKDSRVPKPMNGSVSRVSFDADRDAARSNRAVADAE